MPGDESAEALLDSIDEEQLRLRELLSARDDSRLAIRPANGKWSVVENLRHLLFAEQAHLGPFISGGRQWSTLGLAPPGLQARLQSQGVGTTPTSSVDEILDAWQAAHSSAKEILEADPEQARKALDKNLRHLRNHIKVIERLLRAR